jgi:hypothetical protein
VLSTAFVSVQEEVAPGFKASKGRCRQLLGGKASGECKMKPLTACRSENL